MMMIFIILIIIIIINNNNNKLNVITEVPFSMGIEEDPTLMHCMFFVYLILWSVFSIVYQQL